MMKRFVLCCMLIAMLPVVAKADINIDEEHFPDPAFRNYLLTDESAKDVRGYGLDGVLTDAELADIHRLYPNNKGIKNFKGIEYFPQLDSLGGLDNPVEELDLSRNRGIKWMQWRGTRLRNMDFSNLPDLRYLHVLANESGWELQSISVKGDAELGHIIVHGPITSIDLSDNTKLYQVEIYNTLIREFDITPFCNTLRLIAFMSDPEKITEDNPGLQKMNTNAQFPLLTKFQCQNGSLTEIDLSGMPNLTQIYLYSHKLTSLDLSGHPALTEVAIHNNPLTSLNLKGCTKLKGNTLSWLVLDGTKLTSLDISDCPLIKQVQLIDCGTLENITFPASGSAITKLSLQGNKLKTLDFSMLSELATVVAWENELTTLDVSKNTKLKTLQVDNNPFATLDVSASPSLTRLDATTMSTLTEVKGCPTLTQLRVSNCGHMPTVDFTAMPKLTTLYANNNNLDTFDATDLPKLKTLSLNGNHLHSLKTEDLSLLTKLYVSDNELTALDVTPMKNLSTLYANGNHIPAMDLGDLEIEEGNLSDQTLPAGVLPIDGQQKLGIALPFAAGADKFRNLMLGDEEMTARVEQVGEDYYLIVGDGEDVDMIGRDITYSYNAGKSNEDFVGLLDVVSSDNPYMLYVPDNCVDATNSYAGTFVIDCDVVIPDDLRAFVATDITDGQLTLSPVEEMLGAETAVYVNADRPGYYGLKGILGDEAPMRAVAATAEQDNLLVGVLEQTDVEAGSALTLGVKAGVAGFWNLNATAINANRAYVPASLADGRDGLSLRFIQSGLDTIAAPAQGEPVWYNLQGMRITQPTAPGIYILNGKKVVVK